MIAIITGATGDIGKEFVSNLIHEVDQVWTVGRNEDKLNHLKQQFGNKIVTLSVDLSDKEEILNLCSRIESEKPQIRYLVNNAGVARMAPVSEFSLEEICSMLDINEMAATLLCRACLWLSA